MFNGIEELTYFEVLRQGNSSCFRNLNQFVDKVFILGPVNVNDDHYKPSFSSAFVCDTVYAIW